MSFGDLREAAHARQRSLALEELAKAEGFAGEPNIPMREYLHHHLGFCEKRWKLAHPLLYRGRPLLWPSTLTALTQDIEDLFFIFFADAIDHCLISNEIRIPQCDQVVRMLRAHVTEDLHITEYLRIQGQMNRLHMEMERREPPTSPALCIVRTLVKPYFNLPHLAQMLAKIEDVGHTQYRKLPCSYEDWARAYLIQWILSGPWWST